jgi:hydroxyacylglutathione hydrolase
MKVEQIYTDNSLRNFNYIIACDNTKEAVVIDPLRVDLILELAKRNDYKITKIINTHEHNDHTDGNQELVNATLAKVYCHHGALGTIPCANHGLEKDDVINIGSSVQLKVLDTPGHTMAHVCLLATDLIDGEQAIFSGDTLFNAGAGNVYSGNVDDLFNTFVNILYELPDTTLVFPGHDYLQNNLNFTLSREPDNSKAKDLLAKVNGQDPHQSFVTNLGIEKDINTFFRLNSKEIINKLQQDVSDFSDAPSSKDVFVALRNLRNNW